MCSRTLPSPSTTTRRLGVDSPILKKLTVEDGLNKMIEKPKSCWLYKNNLISIQKSPK